MASDNSLFTSMRTFPTADEMSDLDYWQRLLPEFSVSQQPFRTAEYDYHFSLKQTDQLSKQIRKEGYFQSEPIVPMREIDPLAQAVARINQAGILPVFIAVYDQFWQLLHSFRNTFKPILGELYRMSPDFWVWHIAPNSTARGWTFHRDAQINRPFDTSAKIHEDGQLRLCTIWIPLTDATTHNSCIYVLPFPQDPAIQSFLRKESMEKIHQHAQLTNWTNIRALPAQAGSVLGWNPYILHWGSQSTDWATHARVSIGIYYEAADSPMVGYPFDNEGRRYVNLRDRDCRLSFEDRLRIIANILARYGNKGQGNKGQMDNEPNFSWAVNEFSKRWKFRQE